MKKLSFLILATTALFACTNNGYKICGEATDSLKFAYYSHDYFISEQVDSVAITDGRFVIEGQADSTSFAFIALADGRSWSVILEPGEITLNNAGNTATGTPLNDAFSEFVNKVQPLEDENKIKDIFTETVNAHKGDVVGAYCVVVAKQVISISFAQELATSLTEKGKTYLWKFEPKDKFEIPEKGIEGDMFTDFEVEYNGKIQKLSDYVGKGQYTLVDLWASWCGPCKEEIPNIKKVYEEYGNKGLTVLGVATWDKPEDTEKAITELGITYPQIINAQTIGSDAYGIEGIPHIILFGPDGTILKRDLRGEEILNAIKDVFE
ncbi:MAG: AhpC/TSA family protein [Prevotellaceae bacterium]|nr:AhpC/TSA family protein [Candidatus Colivivens equi]